MLLIAIGLWVNGIHLHQTLNIALEGIFPEGPLLDFSKRFSRGAKSGEKNFFSLETKKTTFFVESFKRALAPLFPLPKPMILRMAHLTSEIWLNPS